MSEGIPIPEQVPEVDNSNYINVIAPSGEVGSVPPEELNRHLNVGYKKASTEDVQNYLRQKEFGSTGQQIVTGLEHAASAATFGLSTPAEIGLRLSTPEKIRARSEENPVSAGVGAGLGLLGSMALPGAGAAGALTKIGEGSAEAVGLGAAESGLAKIGSAAVKGFAENATFQLGDENSKMFSGEYSGMHPSTAAETALLNIGLSGLLGSGFSGGAGAAHSLWEATAAPKMQMLLKTMQDKINGVPMTNIPDPVQSSIESLGIPVTPEIRALMGDSPHLMNEALGLAQSDTPSGLAVKESVDNFRKSIMDEVTKISGKTPEEIGALKESLSRADSGVDIKSALIEEAKRKIEGPVKDFEHVSEKYGKTKLGDSDRISAVDQWANMADKAGYSKLEDSYKQGVVNRIINSMPKQETLEDLRILRKNILDEVWDPMNPQFYHELRSTFQPIEDSIVGKKLALDEPWFTEAHANARQSYSDFMKGLAGEVSERLKPGRFESAKGFLNALENTDPEKFADRLARNKDSNWLSFLEQKLPQTAEAVKDYHLSKILKESVGTNNQIKPEAFIKKMLGLEPETRRFLLKDDSLKKLYGAGEVLSRLDNLKWNRSNTAPTLLNIAKHVPGAAVAAIGFLTGHNPIASTVVGGMVDHFGRNVPDAMRLGLLKWMASAKPIDAPAFKAMVDFIDHTIKGQSLVSRSTKALFKAGQEVLPSRLIPSDKQKEKLNDKLKSLQTNPEDLFDVGGKTPYYLPEHGQGIGQLASNAVNYLNSLRPSEHKNAPLDSEPTASIVQKKNFDNALAIAEQPLVVLNKIKDGNLTPQDIHHLQNLAPALKSKLDNALTEEMANAVNSEQNIPYHVRMGLSLFLGQSLDSTLTPKGILASQPTPQQRTEQHEAKHGKVPMNSLKNMAMAEQTPGQAREASRIRK